MEVICGYINMGGGGKVIEGFLDFLFFYSFCILKFFGFLFGL